VSRIAVVIPTYNNLPELRNCLAALSQQTYTDFTAYVCVDGSTDGTWEYLEQYSPAFVIPLRHPDGRNRGRNAARNLVLPYLSRHEWLAFLDSDSLPLPDWIEQFMRADPSPNEVLLGQILYLSRDNPNPWTEYLRWRESLRARRTLHSYHFMTGNALISAQAFSSMGGMDEKIRRHGLGDVEMGYRLWALGIRFRYVPEAKVWSALQYSPLDVLRRLYDMAQHNLPYLHQKHPHSRDEVFGGKWLYHPARKVLLRMILQPSLAQYLLRKLDKLPPFFQRRAMRYLVLYAVYRGFHRKRLGLPIPKPDRPLP